MNIPDEIKHTLKTISENNEIDENPKQGANSYTFFAKNKITGAPSVVKFYYWGGIDKLHFEPKTLSKLDCKNIIKIFDAGYSSDDYSYFLTEHCEDGDLDTADFARISLYQALDWTSDMLNGLVQIHSSGHVHRDLKPGNLFLSGSTLKIGDFGSIAALPQGKDEVNASNHSILYRPPESFEDGYYTKLSDIYQCGVILYQLCGGWLSYREEDWLRQQELKEYYKLAYPDNTIFADQCIGKRISKGRIINISTLNAWIPNEVKRLVSKASRLEPKRRFSSVDQFLAKITEVRRSIPNWFWQGDDLMMQDSRNCYRIITREKKLIVQQKSASGDWRNKNKYNGATKVSDLCLSLIHI